MPRKSKNKKKNKTKEKNIETQIPQEPKQLVKENPPNSFEESLQVERPLEKHPQEHEEPSPIDDAQNSSLLRIEHLEEEITPQPVEENKKYSPPRPKEAFLEVEDNFHEPQTIPMEKQTPEQAPEKENEILGEKELELPEEKEEQEPDVQTIVNILAANIVQDVCYPSPEEIVEDIGEKSRDLQFFDEEKLTKDEERALRRKRRLEMKEQEENEEILEDEEDEALNQRRLERTKKREERKQKRLEELAQKESAPLPTVQDYEIRRAEREERLRLKDLEMEEEYEQKRRSLRHPSEMDRLLDEDDETVTLNKDKEQCLDGEEENAHPLETSILSLTSEDIERRQIEREKRRKQRQEKVETRKAESLRRMELWSMQMKSRENNRRRLLSESEEDERSLRERKEERRRKAAEKEKSLLKELETRKKLREERVSKIRNELGDITDNANTSHREYIRSKSQLQETLHQNELSELKLAKEQRLLELESKLNKKTQDLLEAEEISQHRRISREREFKAYKKERDLQNDDEESLLRRLEISRIRKKPTFSPRNSSSSPNVSGICSVKSRSSYYSPSGSSSYSSPLRHGSMTTTPTSSSLLNRTYSPLRSYNSPSRRLFSPNS